MTLLKCEADLHTSATQIVDHAKTLQFLVENRSTLLSNTEMAFSCVGQREREREIDAMDKRWTTEYLNTLLKIANELISAENLIRGTDSQLLHLL